MWNKRLLWLIATLAILVLSVYTVVDMVRFPLAYDSVARYHLLTDLNKREPQAMALYQSRYVNHGRYLFNGELTFNMICSHERVDTRACSILYADFVDSNISLNSFVKKYIVRQTR